MSASATLAAESILTNKSTLNLSFSSSLRAAWDWQASPTAQPPGATRHCMHVWLEQWFADKMSGVHKSLDQDSSAQVFQAAPSLRKWFYLSSLSENRLLTLVLCLWEAFAVWREMRHDNTEVPNMDEQFLLVKSRSQWRVTQAWGLGTRIMRSLTLRGAHATTS